MLVNERMESDDNLLRVLIYGNPKTKKTWWAGAAAEHGFNILMLDGDDSWHILRNLSSEAQQRIQVINFKDERGRPIFAEALARLLKDGKLIWDEKEKKSAKLSPNENCININLDVLDDTSILLVDSWTSLVTSLLLQYARENLIDLSVAEEGDDKWGYYRWAGALASWMLVQLKGLNCHVIVTGHTDVYEKRSKDQKRVEWTKRQIKSTSGPHAMQIGDKFSDILYFYKKGTAYKISASGNEDAEGGSRLVAPKENNWDDLQFIHLCKIIGAKIPGKENPHINYSMQQAQIQPVVKSNLVKPVSNPTAKIVLGNVKAK